jgi:hypothetical protein
MITNLLVRVGFLRAALMLATLILVLLSPFAGGQVQTSGWPLVTTLLAPVFSAIMVFVLGLDILMTSVFMSGSSGAERQRLVLILRIEVLLLLILLASWAPFVVSLLRLRSG